MITDAVIGLFLGDEGKSKVVADLARNGKYTHTLRFNGGENCGHTFYVDGTKIITHIVPTGAFFGIKSIIGPGCVVNENNFFKQLEDAARYVPNIAENVKIAYNAHIVLDSHIKEEAKEAKIGTTKKGIGPAYRDKHARTGIRAEDISSLKPFLIDVYQELYLDNKSPVVLCEGAQALGLDVNLGDYPFVTSSACGIGEVINNGISPRSIRDIIGVGKCYTTYVGSKPFQDPKNDELTKMSELGQEIGATTGRRRQVSYLDLNMLSKSVSILGCNKIILNKLDIMKELDIWNLVLNGTTINCGTEQSFKNNIISLLPNVEVIFSSSPHGI